MTENIKLALIGAGCIAFIPVAFIAVSWVIMELPRWIVVLQSIHL